MVRAIVVVQGCFSTPVMGVMEGFGLWRIDGIGSAEAAGLQISGKSYKVIFRGFRV